MNETTPSQMEWLAEPLPGPRATNILLGGFAGFAISDWMSGGLLTAAAMVIPAFLWEGTWLSLLLSALVHSSPLQLIANSMLLVVVGHPVERLYGRGRMLLAFALSAVTGAAASAAILPAAATVSASAGVLGLVGLAVGCLTLGENLLPPEAHGRMQALLAAGTVVNLSFGFFEPQVNTVLHLGGFLTGVCLAFVLEPRLGRKPHPWLALVAGAVLCAGAGTFLLRSRDSVVGTLPWMVLSSEERWLKGDRQGAIALLEPGLDVEERGSAEVAILPAAQNQLAWYYVEEGQDLDRALKLAEEADRLRPNTPEILDTLGYLHALKGNCREAADFMGRAAAANAGYERRRDEVNAACREGRKPNTELPVDPLTPLAPEEGEGKPRGTGIRV